jgi:hypothetical protein
MRRGSPCLAITAGLLALALTPVPAGAGGDPAPAGKAPKPKQIKLACALKSNGSLRFITRSRQCRSRVGKLVKIAPGPVSVCVRKRATIKPRAVVTARRIKNQLAAPATPGRPRRVLLRREALEDDASFEEPAALPSPWAVPRVPGVCAEGRAATGHRAA